MMVDASVRTSANACNMARRNLPIGIHQIRHPTFLGTSECMARVALSHSSCTTCKLSKVLNQVISFIPVALALATKVIFESLELRARMRDSTHKQGSTHIGTLASKFAFQLPFFRHGTPHLTQKTGCDRVLITCLKNRDGRIVSEYVSMQAPDPNFTQELKYMLPFAATARPGLRYLGSCRSSNCCKG